MSRSTKLMLIGTLLVSCYNAYTKFKKTYIVGRKIPCYTPNNQGVVTSHMSLVSMKFMAFTRAAFKSILAFVTSGGKGGLANHQHT